MTNKTFTYAGVSTSEDQTKIRFANDITRVKTLIRHGHDDIDLRELPSALLKGEAVAFLMSSLSTFEPEGQMAIEDANYKYNTVKVTKTKGKVKVTSAAAKAAAEQAKKDKRNARRRELRALAKAKVAADAALEA